MNTILKLSIFCFCILTGMSASAQMNESQLITDLREIDLNAVVFDPANPKDGKAKVLSYSDIEGSPFWDDKWNPAILFFSNGSKAKINQAKLNLYTHEIHYLSSTGTELVVENEGITRLVFLNKNNLTQPIAIFAKLVNHLNDNSTAFYRVFNSGEFQLILLQKYLVKTSPYDPIQAKSVNSFYAKKDYAVYRNGKITSLRDLDRNSVIAILPQDKNHVEAQMAALKEVNTKLKSEKDMAAFLNYYSLMNLKLD